MSDQARKLIEAALDHLADARLSIRTRAIEHQRAGEQDDYLGARGDDHEIEEVEALLERLVAREEVTA